MDGTRYMQRLIAIIKLLIHHREGRTLHKFHYISVNLDNEFAAFNRCLIKMRKELDSEVIPIG